MAGAKKGGGSGKSRARSRKQNGGDGGAPDPASEQKQQQLQGSDQGSSHPPLHNVGDDIIEEWAKKILRATMDESKARKEVQSKNGYKRKLYQDAEKAGVSPSMISWYIQNKDRDPAEIDKETRERTRIARIMNLPIGTQLGFLDDGTTVAAAIDKKKLSEPKPEGDMTAYELGEKFAGDGKQITSNPYDEGTQQYDDFEEGWGAQTRKSIMKMGDGTSAGASAH